MRTTYYAERLADERELMATVKEALRALDIERLKAAAGRINNTALTACAGRVAMLQPIGETLGILEQLLGQLAARIEYLKPLAHRELEQELSCQEREYRLGL